MHPVVSRAVEQVARDRHFFAAPRPNAAIKAALAKSLNLAMKA